MVKKGEFVAHAAAMDWSEEPGEPKPRTEMQILIEACKLIKELETRIEALENP